ncbi:MAG: hypothetical protein HON94_11820 [Methylococcales bacterium]|jgi:hypothetical protein|nr:hypothetical protein [Methylococcales bacterium]MBT7411318.1 hypothetical protein [Methylococcales bacterium]
MKPLNRWQCAFSFLWASTMVAGAITILLFTFFDPAELIPLFRLDISESTIRMNAYAIVFLCFWLAINGSCLLSRYLNRINDLRNQNTIDNVVK